MNIEKLAVAAAVLGLYGLGASLPALWLLGVAAAMLAALCVLETALDRRYARG